MTDQEHGQPEGRPSAEASSQADQPFGTFGSARGSGLARGKRASTPPPTAATPTSSEYKPTAVEVVMPRHEYKHPFEESAPPPPPVEAPVAAAPVAPAPIVSAPVAETPAAEAEPGPLSEPAPLAPAEAEVRSELNILPPAENRRVPMHWENAERSEAGPAPVYPPRAPREDRRERRPEFRPDHRSREGRDPRPAFQAPAPVKPPGGFIAWLKGLFAGKKAPEPVAREHRSDSGPADESQPQHQHRRRHRGGRGRHRGERGEFGGQHRSEYGGQNRGGGSGEPSSSQGGEPQRDGRPGEERSGDFHGGHRRRHRGGRGRHRDERGGPRPEGQQGGGFI